MRAFQEPAHSPLDLARFNFAPEALSYVEYVLKTSARESSVVAATVVSSVYPELLNSSKELGSVMPVSFETSEDRRQALQLLIHKEAGIADTLAARREKEKKKEEVQRLMMTADSILL